MSANENHLIHGHTRNAIRSPTFNSWRGMIDRCKPHAAYGKRGIKVCERWHSFVNFLADMGERPEGMEIDRMETAGNYEPRNCQWLCTTPNRQKGQRNTPLTLEQRKQAMDLKARGVIHREIAAALGTNKGRVDELFRSRARP